MSTFSRRSFLAASAALVAAPALGAVPASGEVDVVIVGAGAAGIAAARRVAAANRRFALLEAGSRDRRPLRHRHARFSACRSISARIGSTTPTAIR